MAAAGVFGSVAKAVSVTSVVLPSGAIAGVAVTPLTTAGSLVAGAGGGTITPAAAATEASFGHRLAWNTGSAIGSAQGAGTSCPTLGEAVPGPSSGPEPQNRKGISCKLAGMMGPPNARFSPKMNSKFGKVYCPSTRPFWFWTRGTSTAVGSGRTGGYIMQRVCSWAGSGAPGTGGVWHIVRLTAR